MQFREENGVLEEVPIDLSEDNYSKEESKKRIFQYKSVVYCKQDKPKWNEVVNVSIPHGKRLDEIKKTPYLYSNTNGIPLLNQKIKI